ncbi:ABC transporter permease, partial [Halococcus hamelinensis]
MSIGLDNETEQVTTERDHAAGWDPRRVGRGIAGLVGFVAVWWAGSLSLDTSYLLPSPPAVLGAFVDQLTTTMSFTLPVVGTDVEFSRMLVKLLQSLLHYVPGLAVGAVLGIGFGLALGWSSRLDDVLRPVVRVLRPIPPLAWIAFAIIWFGIGHTGAAFIVAIGAFWINFYAAYSGVESAPTALREVAASLGVNSNLGMIRGIVLPSAAPQILTGFRTSVGRCWMIVVAAELFGAPGAGYEIINASNNLAMATAAAYMLLIGLVYLCLLYTSL